MSDTPNPNVFFRGDDMGIGNFPIKGGKMSNQPIDGGPAFPMPDSHHANGQVQYGHLGMTLRDYFAAAALQGSIACVGSGGDWNDFAKDAYKYADAMLKARGDK